MLPKIIEILKNSEKRYTQGGTLFCECKIDDLKLINNLHSSGFLENSEIDNFTIGQEVTLEFSLPRLSVIGFFETKKSFLQKNLYNSPTVDNFILEINDFYSKNLNFYNSHTSIINLINTLLKISKYSYEEDEISNAIIIKEEKSLFLPFKYSEAEIDKISKSTITLIEQFTKLFTNEAFEDKKNIYQNTMIEFLLPIDENDRFPYLLANFEEYNEKSQSTYNYYLRNFSYNKLKVELDSKALEFNQKIQSVINDSQTKLIAIPTALVFVLTTFDYENINSLKNYLLFVGVIIFCLFIQIFINNQKSSLGFINENIDHYKQTFEKNKISELEKSFTNVELEQRKQNKRIFMMQLFLWFLPIFIAALIFFVNAFKSISVIIMICYFVFSLFFYLISSHK